MRILESLQTEKWVNRLRIVVTIISVFSPFLAMYSTTISTITFLDVAIGCSVVFILLTGQLRNTLKLKGLQWWLLGAAILIGTNYLINMWGYSADLKVSVFLRCARYIMYLIYAGILLNDGLYDIKLGIRLFRIVSVFAAVYLLLQYLLLYVFDYSLPGYITILPLMRAELGTFTENLGATFYARPRSIFAEPSSIGLFCGQYLVLSILFPVSKDKRWDTLEKVIIVAALALSASSTALLALAISAAIIAVKLINKSKKTAIVIIVAAVCLFVLLFGISDFFRDRVLYLITRLPTSFMNRLGGFIEYGERVVNFSPFDIIFGIGMDISNMVEWYSGLIKILLYFGVIGLVFFCLFVWKVLFVARIKHRAYLVFFLLFCVFSEVLVNSWLVLFLPIVLRDLDAQLINGTFS